MVGENLFEEVGGKLVEKLFSGLLWFGIAIIIISALGVTMWYFLIYKKKFDIMVKLLSHRSGGQNVEILDKGAILIDRKERTPYLRVWNLKRDFTVPKYNVMRKLFEGRKEHDYLEIYRKGEDEFYFLMSPIINKTKILKADGKLYALAEQEQIMMDPEMGFWAVKRKTLNKKMFNTESLIFKLLPYIGILLGGVILIFILYILLDHLPGILSELRKLVAEQASYRRADIVTGATLLSMKLNHAIR